jgi:hypothetical protein
MELKDPITRIEVLAVADNSTKILIKTFNGEEYQFDLAKGEVVEVAIPEDPQDLDYSLLENYLPGPIPQELLQGIEEVSAESVEAPVTHRNKVLEELQTLEPQLQSSICKQCGLTAQLAITHEGIVHRCRACDQSQRIDAELLQRLIDALGIACFSCAVGKLRSEAMEYANILRCTNPDCGSRNSWRGVSDRFQS